MGFDNIRLNIDFLAPNEHLSPVLRKETKKFTAAEASLSSD